MSISRAKGLMGRMQHIASHALNYPASCDELCYHGWTNEESEFVAGQGQKSFSNVSRSTLGPINILFAKQRDIYARV